MYCPICGLVLEEKMCLSALQDVTFGNVIRTRKPEKKRKLKSYNNRFNDSKYMGWREKVIEKFDSKCARCESKGIHCHHIKNYASAPELRFEVDNGILFCKECHVTFHKRFGRKNNDRNQINEFLGGLR